MSDKTLSIAIFLVLIAVTLVITSVTARRVKTDKDFYAAGRQIKGWQNGLAIAGEFMASAAFLGIAGLIAFYGIDAQIYSICWFASFFIVLVLVAEVIRNSGRFTFADIVSYRLKSAAIRPVISIAVLIVSIVYLIPQMVAAGALSKLLFGIDATWGILIVGILMVLYITVGGMVAATWIQSIKAVLLLSCGILLALLTLSHFHFSIDEFFGAVATAPSLAQSWLEPGGWLKNPLERYSLGFGLLFGTAAMPHVIMRFYTVRTKKQARSSAMWTMTFMGIFHVLTFIFGLGAAVLVGPDIIRAFDSGGNAATPLLAQAVAGGEGSLTGALFMAVVVAVAFITIIAAVSGLCIAASSAFSYDFWFNVVKKGKQTPKEQVRTARLSAIAIGFIAIGCALALQTSNVAYLSGLAFALAATVNLPAIVLALFWKGFTTKGALIGIIGGTIVAVFSVVAGPQVMGANAIFPLQNPGLITIPIGFALTFVASLATKDKEAERKYQELSVRSQSGLGSEK
ncbi:MAG: cation acetate symporter [Coriobacteriaceae bacterium]|jgi:cation/acetate symporter|nr:cation acetate symporter [Coriobacteriaceae bacterium]